MPPEQVDQLTARLQADVPHLEQYFGLWSILEQPFRAAVERVGSLDLVAHIRAAQEPQAADSTPLRRSFAVVNGHVGLIEVSGTMMKFASSLEASTSTVRVRRQLRAAAEDAAVSSIVLLIDSPGGTVAGTQELGDDVARAAAKKPVIAYIDDLGASAAYWTASQATKIYANRTALVGSIGTYAAVADYSQWAEQKGIRVHVLRAGDFKGAGSMGTEITDEQLAEWQRIVNEINGHFLAAVAKGRNQAAARVKELADGRVHMAEPAVALGLIDGVRSLDDVLAELETAKPSAKGATRMSQTNDAPAPQATNEPKAATVAEIKSACPGASAEFVLAQVEQGATVAAAMQAHIKAQHEALEANEKELAEAKTSATNQANKPGVPALGTQQSSSSEGGDGPGDVEAEWNEAVDAKLKTHRARGAAIAAVAAERPQLHEAYVAAYNARHGRR